MKGAKEKYANIKKTGKHKNVPTKQMFPAPNVLKTFNEIMISENNVLLI